VDFVHFSSSRHYFRVGFTAQIGQTLYTFLMSCR